MDDFPRFANLAARKQKYESFFSKTITCKDRKKSPKKGFLSEKKTTIATVMAMAATKTTEINKRSGQKGATATNIAQALSF